MIAIIIIIVIIIIFILNIIAVKVTHHDNTIEYPGCILLAKR